MTPNEWFGSVVAVGSILALAAVVLWDRKHWRRNR
jgi:hypothetical protein